MAAHRAGHEPEDPSATLARGVRWVAWAALVATAPMVLLVVGALVFIVITDTPID